MTQDWPQYVALFQPATEDAFIMRKVRDVSNEANVVIARAAAPAPITAFLREYSCGVCHAFYLPRITVESREGKPLPTGSLSVTVDGQIVLEEELGFFLPRAAPPDFLETYPWKEIKGKMGHFKALAAISEDQADTKQVGLMLDNGSILEITLRDIISHEKMNLKIGIPLAEYSTLLPEQEKDYKA